MKNNKQQIKIIIYQPNETVLKSIVKDFVTFLFISFLIAISIWGNSVFWTFITGLTMSVVICSVIMKNLNKDCMSFYSKEELQEFVNSLEE